MLIQLSGNFIINRYLIITVMVAICTFSNVTIASDAHLLTDKHIMSKTISDLIANEEYEEALRVADSVSTSDPLNPYGALLHATVLNSRTVDFEDRIDEEELALACKKVEYLADNYFADKDSSVAYRFYHGSVEMYRMLLQVKRGSYLKAFNGIRRAAKYFEEAVEMDSTFWDAYYGVGIYTYYRSSRAGLLRKLHLIADKRELGINYIQIAADRGTITSLASHNTLGWIAIEQEEYEQSLTISSRLNDQYPNSRAFLWCMGNALKELGRWHEVISVYSRLLESVQTEARNNRYNQLGCLHSLAKAHFYLKDWPEVVKVADQALELNLSESVASRKKSDLRRLKKMRSKARTYLENI